jgi:hypothetical protein
MIDIVNILPKAGDGVHVGVALPRAGADGVALREVAVSAEPLRYATIRATGHIAIPLEFKSRYGSGRPS